MLIARGPSFYKQQVCNVVVKSRELRKVTHLVSREEAQVAACLLAALVVLVRFVHAESKVRVAIAVQAARVELRDPAVVTSVPDRVRTHVLDDELAVGVLALARMLVGPSKPKIRP